MRIISDYKLDLWDFDSERMLWHIPHVCSSQSRVACTFQFYHDTLPHKGIRQWHLWDNKFNRECLYNWVRYQGTIKQVCNPTLVKPLHLLQQKQGTTNHHPSCSLGLHQKPQFTSESKQSERDLTLHGAHPNLFQFVFFFGFCLFCFFNLHIEAKICHFLKNKILLLN